MSDFHGLRPRTGDIVLDTAMRPFTVTGTSPHQDFIRGTGERGRKRTFKLRRLELIDGEMERVLWQETEE